MNRVRRLYATILQKITKGSTLFLLFTTDADFMANGIAVYNYIFEVGHMAFTEDQIKALLDVWNNMTLYNTEQFVKFGRAILNMYFRVGSMFLRWTPAPPCIV